MGPGVAVSVHFFSVELHRQQIVLLGTQRLKGMLTVNVQAEQAFLFSRFSSQDLLDSTLCLRKAIVLFSTSESHRKESQ